MKMNKKEQLELVKENLTNIFQINESEVRSGVIDYYFLESLKEEKNEQERLFTIMVEHMPKRFFEKIIKEDIVLPKHTIEFMAKSNMLLDVIKEKPSFIRYVEDPTVNMQLVALINDPSNIEFIDKPSYTTQLVYANLDNVNSKNNLQILLKKQDAMIYQNTLTTFAKKDPSCIDLFKSPPQCMLDAINKKETTKEKGDDQYER